MKTNEDKYWDVVYQISHLKVKLTALEAKKKVLGVDMADDFADFPDPGLDELGNANLDHELLNYGDKHGE